MSVSTEVGEYTHIEKLYLVQDAANEAGRQVVAATPAGEPVNVGPVIREFVPLDDENKSARLVQVYPGNRLTSVLGYPIPDPVSLTVVRQLSNGTLLRENRSFLLPDAVVQVGFDGEVMDGEVPARSELRTYAIKDEVPYRIDRRVGNTDHLSPTKHRDVVFVHTGIQERQIVADRALQAVSMNRRGKQAA